jgi:hypothetical protein
MKVSWTDDRLDDLNGKVDALRVEMRDEFKAVRSEMHARFDSLQTLMILVVCAVIGGMAALCAALIVIQA